MNLNLIYRQGKKAWDAYWKNTGISKESCDWGFNFESKALHSDSWITDFRFRYEVQNLKKYANFKHYALEACYGSSGRVGMLPSYFRRKR